MVGSLQSPPPCSVMRGALGCDNERAWAAMRARGAVGAGARVGHPRVMAHMVSRVTGIL